MPGETSLTEMGQQSEPGMDDHREVDAMMVGFFTAVAESWKGGRGRIKPELRSLIGSHGILQR